MSIHRFALTIVLVPVALTSTTGCAFIAVPTDFIRLGEWNWSVPVPVSPYYQKKAEDDFYEQERYNRVAIMGPITSGGPAVALDPPSPDEVMRALERARPVEGGFPFLHEVQRNKHNMTIELISDYVDPPRVYPLMGPAQLHHAHYKCTIYFTEVTRHGWPLPHTTVDEDASEVIYVDHDHFHRLDTADMPHGGMPPGSS